MRDQNPASLPPSIDASPEPAPTPTPPPNGPLAANLGDGAIGRLNESDRADVIAAIDCDYHAPSYGECAACGDRVERTIEALERIVREHTERALAEERDRWIARLAHLCDDVWLRNRDRAMDLPDSKTQRWMRRGSSAWEQAANAVRSVLNDLANYDEEYVERHASYMTWLRNGRDRDELRAARQEQR